MGGDNKEGGGYGAMTIDALATGVSQGGGMGIAKQIEMALSHHSGPADPAIDPTAAVSENCKK